MAGAVLIACALLLAAGAGVAQDQSVNPSAAEHLAAAIDGQDPGAVQEALAELRAHPGNYEFDEEELADLGSRLLDEQRIEEALAVFELNTEMFPDSALAHFDLAVGCLHAGDRPGMKRSLRAALERYPTFWIAEFILEDLDGRIERAARERARNLRAGEPTGLRGPYLGQEPPGLTAEIFAPGIVSRALALNFSCTFSPDGTEFYFNDFMTIMVCRLREDGWTAPEPVAFTKGIRAHEPYITPDGRRLYFGWFPEAEPGTGTYVCDRTDGGWGEPRFAGKGRFVTSSGDGTVYVAERREPPYSYIRRAILDDGVIVGYEPLGGGLTDLHEQYDRTAHPCISPDGRTILFDSSLRSGLRAAFRDEAGVWSGPVDLGEHGLPREAGIANYSPDGKYIFFSDKGDIWWVDSAVVEDLRPGG